MDSISDLPYDVIRHIVSFLSAKEAMRAKVISKNWLNLYSIQTNLVFDPKFKIEGSFEIFVAGLLARHPSYRVRSFFLRLRSLDFDAAQYKLFNDCIRNVLKRGILDIELDINVKEDYSLPLEVFSCRTVVNLKLGSCFVIDIIPKNALLPELKTLTLDSVRFEGLDGLNCTFNSLLSACPVLEELVIDGLNWEQWKWSRTVSSLTLKRLTIRRQEWEPDEWSDFETISFDTPNLAYLEYEDYILNDYPIVNLNSLVEAKLYLPTEANHFEANGNIDPTNLIKGLKNVESMSIDGVDLLLGISHAFSEAVPLYEKLLHLLIVSEADFCWYPLRLLLEKSPNLKTLTIEGSLHYRENGDLESVCECLLEYSFLESCLIEVLKITDFSGEIGEFVQLKHVLKKLMRLELLEIHVQARGDDEKLQILADLLMLPRVSSNCKILVKFS